MVSMPALPFSAARGFSRIYADGGRGGRTRKYADIRGLKTRMGADGDADEGRGWTRILRGFTRIVDADGGPGDLPGDQGAVV